MTNFEIFESIFNWTAPIIAFGLFFWVLFKAYGGEDE